MLPHAGGLTTPPSSSSLESRIWAPRSSLLPQDLICCRATATPDGPLSAAGRPASDWTRCIAGSALNLASLENGSFSCDGLLANTSPPSPSFLHLFEAAAATQMQKSGSNPCVCAHEEMCSPALARWAGRSPTLAAPQKPTETWRLRIPTDSVGRSGLWRRQPPCSAILTTKLPNLLIKLRSEHAGRLTPSLGQKTRRLRPRTALVRGGPDVSMSSVGRRRHRRR